MVLEDGAVVGLGTHEELIRGCAVYREIYRSQLGDPDEGPAGGAAPAAGWTT